jgi:outer membrane receptor for ferrienterochelin and colicins
MPTHQLLLATSRSRPRTFGRLSASVLALALLLPFGAAAEEAEAEAAQSEEQVATDAATTETPADDDLTFFLDPVVVTATRTERDQATAPASVSVITSEDLQKVPVGDLTDAIRDTPGISIQAGSQGRRALSIRGMGSNYTLILVDGKRVNSSEAVFRHNDFDMSQLPVEAIDRIEVVRGSMSSLYGSDALGGVINIITKPVAERWTAGIDAKAQTPMGGSSGQEYRTSLYASGPLVEGKLGLRLTGAFDLRQPWHGASDPNGPVLNNGGAEVLRPDGSAVRRGDLATLEGRSDHNVRGRLVWTPDAAQTLSAEYGFGHQTRSGEYFIASAFGVADSTVQRSDVVLAHEGKWGWGTSMVRGYWELVETTPDELRQDNFVLEGNSSTEWGAHALTFGAEGRWTELQAEGTFTSGAASVTQQAVYAQDEIELTSFLSLLLGARLDHHENFGFHPPPRDYLVVTPHDHIPVKGGVGTGFRAPTLRQLSDESIVTSCRGACVIVGNPDLEPEKSISYELNASYEPRGWGVSAGVFQNDVSNLIDTPRGAGVDPIGHDPDGLPIFVPRNVNQARLRGVEAGAHTRISTVRLRANYTLLDAMDLDNDEQLDNRPRHTLNGQVDWSITQQVSVFTRGQYIGEQKSGEETIDGYTLFDAGLSYRPYEAFGLTAGVLNIADTRTDTVDGFSYQERGRTIFLGMNARY